MTPRQVARAVLDEVWGRLAAPLRRALPPDSGARGGLSLVQDLPGPTAELVRQRLDAVVPGAWELSVELVSRSEVDSPIVKARLTVLGVAREDLGTGLTISDASDQALVRAAGRFGIGARAVEPVAGDINPEVSVPEAIVVESDRPAQPSRRRSKRSRGPLRLTVSADDDFPSCPKCGDVMWDDRGGKANDDSPDFRCRRKGCGGALWVGDMAPAAESGTPSAATPAEEEGDFPF